VAQFEGYWKECLCEVNAVRRGMRETLAISPRSMRLSSLAKGFASIGATDSTEGCKGKVLG